MSYREQSWTFSLSARHWEKKKLKEFFDISILFLNQKYISSLIYFSHLALSPTFFLTFDFILDILTSFYKYKTFLHWFIFVEIQSKNHLPLSFLPHAWLWGCCREWDKIKWSFVSVGRQCLWYSGPCVYSKIEGFYGDFRLSDTG